MSVIKGKPVFLRRSDETQRDTGPSGGNSESGVSYYFVLLVFQEPMQKRVLCSNRGTAVQYKAICILDILKTTGESTMAPCKGEITVFGIVSNIRNSICVIAMDFGDYFIICMSPC